jgi:chromosome segregation ATPase
MTVPEMMKAMSKLRLALASIEAKERELDALRRQFQRQLARTRTHAIYGANSLDASLGIMDEVQERLDDVETRRHHLDSIKERAQEELTALELTNKIEQAKVELKTLKARGGDGIEDRHRIEKLEHFIESASLRAAEAITGRLDVGGDVNLL